MFHLSTVYLHATRDSRSCRRSLTGLINSKGEYIYTRDEEGIVVVRIFVIVNTILEINRITFSSFLRSNDNDFVKFSIICNGEKFEGFPFHKFSKPISTADNFAFGREPDFERAYKTFPREVGTF